MYTKALTFNYDDIAEQILDSEDPDEINELGRQVSGYDDVIWNCLRQAVVYEGLKVKFEQDDELCSRLLSILDANRRELDCWKGQNLLGFSLMRVRERLRIDHAGSRYHRGNLAKKIVYDCLRH